MPTNNSWNSQDPVQVTKGGTGLNTVAQGDLLIASASNTLASLPKDTNSTRYLSNTGTNNAPAYAQVNLSNGVTGTLPVGNGGLGITTTPTNGQIPIGNGTNYTAATLTAGSGISLTNAAGSVTIDNTRSAPAMVLLHTITFNGTFSSVDLTPFVSGYDIYQFISTPVPNLNVNNIILEFSVTGGASWITSGYFTDLASFDGGSISGNQAFTAGIPIVNYGGGGAPTNYSGVNNTTMTGYGSAQGPYVWGLSMTTFGGRCVPQIFAGFLPNTVVNGIRIVEGTPGNWTAGKFSIYGIAT